MMKKIIVVFSMLLMSLHLQAQLSENSKIYLVTTSPGSELYSAFGHSAIWVTDTNRGLDVLFNYGTFDFDTPNFYTKFAMGYLDYMLSLGRINRLVEVSKMENRSVYAQELDLDSAQKNEIYAFLVNNYREENRYYRYDFLYDNCSTRIRDVFEDVLGDDLVWNKIPKQKSFRDYLSYYTEQKPWINLGFGLILGQTLDRTISAREEMFMPEELMEGFETARLNGKLFVKDTLTLYEAEEEKYSSIFEPKSVFWLIAILGFFLSIRQHRRKFHVVWFDRILFIAAGLVGLIITVLWFFTEHHVTVENWNIVWANPLHLVAAFFLFKENSKKWHHLYYIIFGSVAFFMVGFFYALPQTLHIATFPIILYMCFRCFIIFYKTKKIN